MSYLFTSESVSEGHPDKIADQISDALVDNFLAFDKNSKVACETLVTTGQVILAGEVKSNVYLNYEWIYVHITYTTRIENLLRFVLYSTFVIEKIAFSPVAQLDRATDF